MGRRYSKKTRSSLAPLGWSVIFLAGLVGGCDHSPPQESRENPPVQQLPTPPAAPARAARTEHVTPTPFGDPEPLETRRWSDTTGKFSTGARFVGLKNEKVALAKPDNTVVEVPLDRLSENDRRYVSRVTVKTITGRVVSVSDGDTITVVQDGKSYRVRLEGIDAPENTQAFGAQAKKALIGKLLQANVQIVWKEQDEFDRVLGHVYVGGRWVNKELIEEGFAWHYKQYNKSTALAQAEAEARARRSGLWNNSDPIAPWEYRRNPVKPVAASVATPPPSPSPPPIRSESDHSHGGSVEVRGYYRKDGTYVKPHTRKSPQR